LVILVPVLFGFIGFAVDLGQLYLIRGELKTAASSMALAAAQRLIGTDQGITDATNASHLPIDDSSGFANKYNFGGLTIGQANGFLQSSAADPSYYATLQDALSGSDSGGGSIAARHARVTLTAEAPLTFWRFLPIASDGKVTVAASAVAGISAPLCTACGIENFAVAAINASDTTDFGFVADTKYTLGYSCNGVPVPSGLAGAPARLPYVLLNRLSSTTTVFTDENSQLFRIGGNGLPGNTDSTQACFTINTAETIWANATPSACAANTVAPPVRSALCGLTSRFETTPPAACLSIPDIETLSGLYSPDSDISSIDAYASYSGNGRRVITIPIVDVLNPLGSMTVLGFRQFLVEPDPSGVDVNPGDTDARFVVLYVGSLVPVKQGRIDGCQISAGPGKVVLHQ
jgi:Flp pilus assembly protein TadG